MKIIICTTDIGYFLGLDWLVYNRNGNYICRCEDNNLLNINMDYYKNKYLKDKDITNCLIFLYINKGAIYIDLPMLEDINLVHKHLVDRNIIYKYDKILTVEEYIIKEIIE